MRPFVILSGAVVKLTRKSVAAALWAAYRAR